jgi:ferredoxin
LIHTIALDGSAIRFRCCDDQTILAAQMGAGVAAINVGCRGGGCGVCRVQILSGPYRTGTMSRAQVSTSDVAAGIVLACQVIPQGDLRLRPLAARPVVAAPVPDAHQS